jgi:hypothetical protein
MMRRLLVAAALSIPCDGQHRAAATGAARGAKALFEGAQIDPPALELFERACQDCHSANTRWPWYRRIPPASWLIRKDVNDARLHVDFSNYQWTRAEKSRLRAGQSVTPESVPPPVR